MSEAVIVAEKQRPSLVICIRRAMKGETKTCCITFKNSRRDLMTKKEGGQQD